MRSVKSRDTKPELIIRKALHRNGFRFRVENKDLPGTPDIKLPKYKTVIFINGCFWHKHICKVKNMPKSNTAYWENKIDRNVSRDKVNCQKLNILGWNVIVVWECALSKPKLKLSIEALIKIIITPRPYAEIS